MENKEVSVLIESGLTRIEAKTLLFLFKHNKTTSRLIERGTYLRQPEVSNAMTSFSKRGWISKRKGSSNKERGRPETTITLVRKKEETIETLKEQLRQNSIQINKTLEKLDKIFQEEK
jgi:predicted transcriptional regulator